MVRCWCHAAMGGWLGTLVSDVQVSSEGRMRRWQLECERAGGDCASRLEAIALRLPCARAVRSGPTLRLYTAAGPVEFTDQRGSAAAEYRYLGLLDVGPQHLVWRRDADGIRFLTVGDQDGRQCAFRSLAQVQSSTTAPQQPRGRDAFAA